jgi:fluoroquinolone transport system permease protein
MRIPLKALLAADSRSIARDTFLSWMLILPLLNLPLLRWGYPWMAQQLSSQLKLMPYAPLAVAYIIGGSIPLLFGTVIGFLLIDERDEGTLQALQVTPLSLSGFLHYRILFVIALSAIAIALELYFCGLVSFQLWQALLIGLNCALFAPFCSLFLMAFADNKVQGFAMLKILGALMMLPMGAWFIAPPMQYLCGLFFPLYWAWLSIWQIGSPGIFGLASGLGLLLQTGVIWLLYRSSLKRL